MEEFRMEMYRTSPEKSDYPLWEKLLLTVTEAASYSGIGSAKLKELCEKNEEKLVFYNGRRRLIRRKELEHLIEQNNHI